MKDLIIFSGQSNMQGSTGQIGYLEAKGCFEYKYLIDDFVALKDPVGEDIGNGLFCAPVNGCGSLVPAFCKACRKKKSGVVGVHCAKGNTSISEWLPGTERYDLLIKKAQRAIYKTNEKFGLGKKFFVWLQGESDALLKTTEEVYIASLIQLKNALKSDLAIDKFCIIKVGYFAEYATWVPLANKTDDETIMRAQERVAEIDDDFVVLTNICSKLSVKSKFLNPKEYGPHYNNRALKIIGKEAGISLAKRFK